LRGAKIAHFSEQDRNFNKVGRVVVGMSEQVMKASAELQSEDVDCPSSLLFDFLQTKTLMGAEKEAQTWQLLQIRLASGPRTITSIADEDIMLCRTPTDELEQLIRHLEELCSGKKEQVYFEPAEPSFELNLSRTNRGGIKVELWLDAGNGTTDIYTWDAAGIRFMTNPERLSKFIEQLHGAIAP
jgi:hypothetical protein